MIPARQVSSDRECTVARFASGSAWHDCSYIAEIALLAHGLTVKLSPWPVSGWTNISCMSAWTFQMDFATRSGSSQDDAASF